MCCGRKTRTMVVALAMSAVGMMVMIGSGLKAQPCPEVQPVVDPNEPYPVFSHRAYYNEPVGMDFLAELDPSYPEWGLKWLFNTFFIQAYAPFRPVERLTIPAGGGLRVRCEGILGGDSAGGVRLLHGFSLEPQSFTASLTFRDNPDPADGQNGQRYVELTIRNSSDLRHRALGLAFRTGYSETAAEYQSKLSVWDLSDDRVPASYEWDGNHPDTPCLLPALNMADVLGEEIELILMYQHGAPAKVAVGLNVGSVIVIPTDPVDPNYCEIELPEPIQTMFRFFLAVKDGGGDLSDPLQPRRVDTTLLDFNTDLTYSGEGYIVNFSGMQEVLTAGPREYNQLYDHYVEGAPGTPATARHGWHWGMPPLLSEHGIDFGRTMTTPVLGSWKYLEISGHKPVNGLLVKSERWVDGVVGGPFVTSYHTILSQRERPGLMTQIFPEGGGVMPTDYKSFTPIRFLPELFSSTYNDTTGLWELDWTGSIPAGCPSGDPNMVVDVQDSGFLTEAADPSDYLTSTMAVTYCNLGGQTAVAVDDLVTITVDSPVMEFVESEDGCVAICKPEPCRNCDQPGDCDNLCEGPGLHPGSTQVICPVTPVASQACGRVQMKWRLRAPDLYDPTDPSDPLTNCLPNSCGSTGTTQSIRVQAKLDVQNEAPADTEDNSFEYTLSGRFPQPFSVCPGHDVCADEYNCGSCGDSCLAQPFVRDAICQKGNCRITACAQDATGQRYDCDLDSTNGCETVASAAQQFVKVVPGFPDPPWLNRIGPGAWSLYDDFDYDPDPVRDEQELHRRWSFLGYPPPPDGPRIFKDTGSVSIMIDAEGEDSHSGMMMYSQRRLPPPTSLNVNLLLLPYCFVGRCELGLGVRNELHEHSWGYFFSIDTQYLVGNVWRDFGYPNVPPRLVEQIDLSLVLEDPSLGDNLHLYMEYHEPTQELAFGVFNLDIGVGAGCTLWNTLLDQDFYLFIGASVGAKTVYDNDLDITLYELGTAVTFNGYLYDVSPAPLRYGLTPSTLPTDFDDIPHLLDPQLELKKGAVWQVMPTTYPPPPTPPTDIQLPLVAVMTDNWLQIHGARPVNALLVTLKGPDEEEIHSTFYSQAGVPSEILHYAGIMFPEVVRIDRFLPGIFQPDSSNIDFVWSPPVYTDACTGSVGVGDPSVDVQMSGARPGRSETVIITTCNAQGLADNPELRIELPGILRRITVPWHCSCSTGLAGPPCASDDYWDEAVVTCDLPDLGSGVCVQTVLELDVEAPGILFPDGHNISCDPSQPTEVWVEAVLSWSGPQGNPLDLPPFVLTRYADCAWDPNVKLAVPESPGTIAPGGLLHYFIFYENDPQATAPAIDIRITDELDPGLDETTLSMISRGGWYDPGTRTIIWELNGINLPPGEGGHVEFFVRALPGLAPGTVIEDQASITFDFNPPVLTPTTLHVIAEAADTTPPRMHPCVDLPLLWPPNHKLVPVVIDSWVSDDSGGPVSLAVFVESSEPEQGSGFGNKAPDWTGTVIDQQTGTVELELRSERYDAHQGRTYTIRLEATDQAGNVSTAMVKVLVPGNTSLYNQEWSRLQNNSRYAHCQFSALDPGE